MSGDWFHYGHDLLGQHWGWVDLDRGGVVPADKVIQALQADVKMLRDQVHSLRVGLVAAFTVLLFLPLLDKLAVWLVLV